MTRSLLNSRLKREFDLAGSTLDLEVEERHRICES